LQDGCLEGTILQDGCLEEEGFQGEFTSVRKKLALDS
jgi:hypothetical protein